MAVDQQSFSGASNAYHSSPRSGCGLPSRIDRKSSWAKWMDRESANRLGAAAGRDPSLPTATSGFVDCTDAVADQKRRSTSRPGPIALVAGSDSPVHSGTGPYSQPRAQALNAAFAFVSFAIKGRRLSTLCVTKFRRHGNAARFGQLSRSAFRRLGRPNTWVRVSCRVLSPILPPAKSGG